VINAAAVRRQEDSLESAARQIGAHGIVGHDDKATASAAKGSPPRRARKQTIQRVGRDWRKLFLLDERDQLSEYAEGAQ
jgi:hypothetical protein